MSAGDHCVLGYLGRYGRLITYKLSSKASGIYLRLLFIFLLGFRFVWKTADTIICFPKIS